MNNFDDLFEQRPQAEAAPQKQKSQKERPKRQWWQVKEEKHRKEAYALSLIHILIIGRRRILGDDAVNKMAQVNLLGKPAFAYRFHKALVFFVVEPHLYAAVSFPHSLSSSWRRLI